MVDYSASLESFYCFCYNKEKNSKYGKMIMNYCIAICDDMEQDLQYLASGVNKWARQESAIEKNTS